MYLWSVCGIPNCVNPAHLLYGSRQEMERWYKNCPRLSPEQIEEARYLFRQQHKQVHELRQRYRLTDGEMRKVLGL
jgi:hypothetical protein